MSIYYTTDLTIPTKETGILYEGPITVGREDTNTVTHVTAVAEKDGRYSRLYRWSYTIAPPSRNLVNASTSVKVVDYVPYNGNEAAPFKIYHTGQNVTLAEFSAQLTSNTVGDGQNSYAYFNNEAATTYIEFDLGGEYTVNRMDWQRTAYFNTAADGVRNVRILASTDGVKWIEVYYNPGTEEMERSQFGVWNDCKYAEITFAPTAARYIRASAGYANEEVFASMINIYEGNFTYSDLTDYSGKNILAGHPEYLTLENYGMLDLGHGLYPVYVQNSQPTDLPTFYNKLTDGVIGDGHESYYYMNLPAEQETTYLQIDLRRSFTLDRFEIQRGVYENDKGPENLKLEGSLDGKDWFVMYHEPGMTQNTGTEQGIWNMCNFASVEIAPATVRYIRLSQGQPGQMTALSELRLYAADTANLYQTIVPDQYFEEYRDPTTLAGKNMLLGHGEYVTLQNYAFLNLGSGELPVYVQSGATIKLNDFYYKLVDGVIGDGHESYYYRNVPADQGTTYVHFDLQQPVTIDKFDAQPGAYINDKGIFNLKIEGSLDGKDWFVMYHEPGETKNTDWEQGPWNQCNFARVGITPVAVRYVRVSMGQPDETVGFSEFRLYAAAEQIPVLNEQKISVSYDTQVPLSEVEAMMNDRYGSFEFLVNDKTTVTLPIAWSRDFDEEDYAYGGVFTFRGTPVIQSPTLSNLYQTGLVLEVSIPVAKADTRALEELVATADKLNASGYAAATWKNLQKSLAAAKTVLANDDATRIMVDDAWYALDHDLRALAPAADTKALKSKVDELASVKGDAYTTATYALLTHALNQANAMLGTDKPTQEACDAVLAGLIAAYEELVDRTGLSEAVAAAEAAVKSAENYTKSSYADYTAALTAAKTAMEEATSAETVEGVKKDLDTAVKQLAEAGDKSVLEQLIGTATGVDDSRYTASSMHLLEKAVTVAKNVVAGEDVSADEVETARADLQAALDGLVEPGDKTELNQLIATYGTEAYFAPSAWSVFKPELDAALLVANNSEATKEEVETAVSALKTAAEKLVRVGDKTKLAEMLTNFVEDESKYTSASYRSYLRAYEAAELVMADAEASEADVQSAVSALTAALEGLDVYMERTPLDALIDEACLYLEGNYTPESLAALEAAIAEARAIAALEGLSAREMADAMADLSAAMTAMVPAESAKKGCGSALSGMALVLIATGLLVCTVKRKEND